MNAYETSVTVLVKGIKEYVSKAKRRGTVGMSIGNLMQVVSTSGVTVPITDFSRCFGDAVKTVRRETSGFQIYDSEPGSHYPNEDFKRSGGMR